MENSDEELDSFDHFVASNFFQAIDELKKTSWSEIQSKIWIKNHPKILVLPSGRETEGFIIFWSVVPSNNDSSRGEKKGIILGTTIFHSEIGLAVKKHFKEFKISSKDTVIAVLEWLHEHYQKKMLQTNISSIDSALKTFLQNLH